MDRSPQPGFTVVAEVEPATRPNLMRFRHQIGMLSVVADALLIPDNPIGAGSRRAVGLQQAFSGSGPFQVGATTRLGPVTGPKG